MSETCQSLIWRAPTVDGQLAERHAHPQRCGRPVEAEGLCARHLRLLEPIDERGWRKRLRLIKRG